MGNRGCAICKHYRYKAPIGCVGCPSEGYSGKKGQVCEGWHIIDKDTVDIDRDDRWKRFWSYETQNVELMKVFMYDENPHIRENLAYNAHCPRMLLEILSHDEDIYVRVRAKGRIEEMKHNININKCTIRGILE